MSKVNESEEVSDNEEVSENEEETEESGEIDERIPIDLSQNEIYRGICTLFEDEDGNNILEYISLLHTELIGINKSLENLKSIKKDMSRIADCAETFLKTNLQQSQQSHNVTVPLSQPSVVTKKVKKVSQ